MISRTIVVADRCSSPTLVEDLTSEPGPRERLAVPLLEVHAGDGAKVRYAGIRRVAEKVWDLGTQRYRSARDSDLASLNVFVGSGRTKAGIESDMEAGGAIVKLYGLVAAGDAQRIDVNSFQDLDGKGSQSDLLYLSALYDSAKAVFYGKIRVEATSSGTGSYQECRNMLLSKKASADPIPVLEILTNDVARCGHGATAGALGDEELFYAMSRGFIAVAREDEVPPGEVKVVQAGAKSLCLGHCEDGTWGAIDNVCTHDGGVLGEGELEDCLVECPRHGARFDLTTGEVRALPAVFPVNAYPVRVVEGRVEVDLSVPTKELEIG